MDFKVAGDKEGITAFQLDIKCEGLSVQTMERALEQARVGRLHILGEMNKALDAPRAELPATVPRMASFSVEESSIGKVIGPGGKTIRGVIEDFGLSNMDVGEDGQIQLSGFSTEKLAEAQAFVEKLVAGGGGRGGGGRKERPRYDGPEPVVGATYTGKITGIQNFGVFVEILPGLEGLVHVSELHTERVRNCEGYVRSMSLEELTVKYVGKDKGKIRLSRKAWLEESKGNG
jgi:polyribonucleotide nucleotidyltransferase